MPRDPFAALRIAPFRRYIIGRAIQSLGALMQGVAVGWDVYERTGSASALGLLGLAQVLPVLLVSLPAGQVIDRVNRRSVILVATASHATVAVALALLSWTQAPVGWIYVALFVSGVARAFLHPAHSSLIPQIVPPSLFPNAVTWSANSFYTAASIGPALGGFAIAWSGGATAVYAFSVFTSLLCVAIVASIPRPPDPAPSGTPVGWESLSAGVRYVWRTRMILAPMTLDMCAVILGGCTTLLPIFAKDILQVGPAGLGWLRAAPSIGGVLSALAMATLPPFQRAGRALLCGVAGFGVATIVFGFSRNFALSCAMLFVAGAADMVSVVIRQTLIQTLTPDQMRGRVSAVNSVFIGASNELGGFESGLTAAWFGALASVVGGGIGTLLVVVCAIRLWPELTAFGALPAAAEKLGVEAAEEEQARKEEG